MRELYDNDHALDKAGLASQNAHLGDKGFPQKPTSANISDGLLNARIDFGVWPRDVEGRIPRSEEALRCDELAYFGMEPPLDRPVLTSDCGSDVSVGAEKDSLWDCNRCVSLCEHSCATSSEMSLHTKSLWNP